MFFLKQLRNNDIIQFKSDDIISQKLRGSFSLDEFIESGIEFRSIFFLRFFPLLSNFFYEQNH